MSLGAKTWAGKASSIVVASIGLSLGSTAAFAAQPAWKIQWAESVGKQVVAELTEACPLGDPGDQQAFEKCQAAAYKSEFITDSMRDFLLWGGKKVGTPIEDAGLTQFNKEIWRSLYLPMFMFTGEVKIDQDEAAGRIRVRAETRFRDILKPGEYPYPFWHDDAKWGAYLKANELVFTIDVRTAKIIGIQRSPEGEPNPNIYTASAAAPRQFNKDEWMWRDDEGVLQPKVTVFDGIYSADNPHLVGVEKAYFDFALELRNNTCMVCHVPNNPEKMKNLVLLQTPAHAAGEIDRTIRVVKGEAMPQKSWAGPAGWKDPVAKEKFLKFAEAFKAEVDAAIAWERGNNNAPD